MKLIDNSVSFQNWQRHIKRFVVIDASKSPEDMVEDAIRSDYK